MVHLNWFGSFNIPQNDLMVEASAQNEILHCRMPLNVVDTTLMTMQIDFPLVCIDF